MVAESYARIFFRNSIATGEVGVRSLVAGSICWYTRPVGRLPRIWKCLPPFRVFFVIACTCVEMCRPDFVRCPSLISLLLRQLYPYECQERLVDVFTTGDDVTVDLTTDTLKNNTTGERTIN